MKKKLLSCMFCLFGIAFAYAQSDFVPVGGTATGSAGSVTYTVGQVAVQSAMKTFKIVKMR